MDEHDLDVQLGELFKRNVPFVNAADVEELVRQQLAPRRRRNRRSRLVRAAALAFASIVLTSGAAWGVYRLVDYLHEEPALVITDPTLMPGTTVSLGIGAPGTVAAMRGTSAIEGVLPVAGTAALEQVKSEGAGAASDDPGFATQVIGQVRVFRLQMSQAEVSGALVVTSDLSVRADGRTDVHSSWVLTNDVGSWECDSGSGHIPRDGTEEFGFGTAAGTGEYEGQTLCLQWHIKRGGASAVGSGSTGSTPVSGWIQPAEKEAGSVVDGRTPFVAAVAGGFEGGVCRTDTSDPLQTFNRRGHFEVETSDHRVAGEVEAKVDRSIYPNPGASLEVRGKWTLANSGGAWTCDTYTDAYEGENYFVFIEASGAGGYEGLKLYGQCHSVADWVSILSDADRHEFIMSGWIEGGRARKDCHVKYRSNENDCGAG